jgi:large subunit ribosomal protein L25
MEEVVLKATTRIVVGKQVKALRREGGLPAVLYGKTIEPMNVTLNQRDATRILSSITSSHLVVIELEGQRHTALVREKQRHPVQAHLMHIDFQVVSMTEKIRTSVVIDLIGEAPAVKDYNGALVTGVEELEVEALPRNLPEKITVDLAVLRKIGDSIHVSDLEIPAKVEVITDSGELVVLVTGQAAEAEEEVTEVGAAEPEVIERGRKEEEF